VAVGRGAAAEISDSDIRNCHYAGVTIGRGATGVIERCRISGAAWHGIRYDDVSPVIADNLIFANARSGIYASGSTAAQIRGNVFFGNEMCGVSCWYNNRDAIAGNTFVGNLREGLDVLGASAPSIRSNIFSGHRVAIHQGLIGSREPAAQTLGDPEVVGNLFWNNATNWLRKVEGSEVFGSTDGTAGLRADPKFRDAAALDFGLTQDSPARLAWMGAPQPPVWKSPWPLQAEEEAIVPTGPTRDSRQWKRPAPR